jgi:hypothetical protein
MNCMLSLLLLAPVALEAEADRPVSVLVLDIKSSPEDSAAARVLDGELAEHLSVAEGLEVSTVADLRRMVDLEAEKASMSCDAESCMGEIAGALGVRYVVFGEMGRIGDATSLNLSLFDAEAARPVFRKSLRADEPMGFSPQLKGVARAMLVELAERSPKVRVPEANAGSVMAVAGFAGAVALGAVAVVADLSLGDASAGSGAKSAAYWGGWTAVVGATVAAGVGVAGLVMMGE